MAKGFGFKSKLFISYSIVVLIIVTASLLFFYSYVSSTTEKSAVDNISRITLKSSDQIDSMIDSMDRINLQVITNQNLWYIFSDIRNSDASSNYFDTDTNANFDIQKILFSINGPNSTVARISIFNFLGDYSSSGLYYDNPESADTFLQGLKPTKILQKLNSLKGKRYISKPHPDHWSKETNTSIVSLYRIIKNISNDVLYGIVEVQQPLWKIEKLLVKDDEMSLRQYIYFGPSEKDGIEEPYRSQASEYFIYLSDSPDGNVKISSPYTGKPEILIWHRSETTGWTVFTVQSTEALYNPFSILGKFIIIIGAIILLISLGVVFIISNRLTKPLSLIRKSVNTVTIENLALDLEASKNNDELIQLNKAFSKMFERLKTSMDELVGARSSELRSHLLALQSQIDPHFIHNVLSVISAAGMENGNIKVMDLCHMLSNMLRYSTSFSQKNVTLKDEINYVEIYLNLMKERYGKGLNFDIIIDSDIPVIAVPKFILQPLVENCFKHGFVKIKPPWEVRVHMYTRDNAWFVEVSDNGEGFSSTKYEELLKKINNISENISESIQEMETGGLGILNTTLRLKLLYGKEFFFKVENGITYGTVVTIGGVMNSKPDKDTPEE